MAEIDRNIESELGGGSRLHPMTVLHRFITSAPGFLLIVLAAMNSQDWMPWLSLYMAIGLGVATLPPIILRYERFRYWITDEELIIRSGVLKTQNRSIPIERIQNVEIVQRLLSRIFSTARVNVVTAGSAGTEGVLEYVSLIEAERIRATIREKQKELATATRLESPASPLVQSEGPAPTLEAEHLQRLQPSFTMPLQKVLLSGAFKFSLLYIAVFFSTLQFISPDPEVLMERVLDRWGPTVQPIIDTFTNHIFLGISLALVVAALMSWVSGIAVNLNKLYNFKLWLTGGKIEKVAGLLTRREGTIPLRKIQAAILRTNPAMRFFNYWALEVQTIGLDVSEAGNKSVIPFAKLDTIQSLIPEIFPVPLTPRFNRVSKLTIRRIFFRSSFLLFLITIPAYFAFRPLGFLLFLVLPILGYAILHYRYHGYYFDGEFLGIRRGVVTHTQWTIPIKNVHVFYSRASFFQRRLNLKSIVIDSAGAGAIRHPVIIDLHAPVADRLLQDLYNAFQFAHHESSGSRNVQSPR